MQSCSISYAVWTRTSSKIWPTDPGWFQSVTWNCHVTRVRVCFFPLWCIFPIRLIILFIVWMFLTSVVVLHTTPVCVGSLLELKLQEGRWQLFVDNQSVALMRQADLSITIVIAVLWRSSIVIGLLFLIAEWLVIVRCLHIFTDDDSLNVLDWFSLTDKIFWVWQGQGSSSKTPRWANGESHWGIAALSNRPGNLLAQKHSTFLWNLLVQPADTNFEIIFAHFL